MTINEILDYKLEKILGSEQYTNVNVQDKNFILAQAKSKIQTYCHRLDIPKEAYFIWADMAIVILKELNSSLFVVEAESDLMDRIKGVKSGDTTLDFSENKEETKGLKYSYSDDILKGFAKQLQAFRKFSNGSGSGLNGI